MMINHKNFSRDFALRLENAMQAIRIRNSLDYRATVEEWDEAVGRYFKACEDVYDLLDIPELEEILRIGKGGSAQRKRNRMLTPQGCPTETVYRTPEEPDACEYCGK